MLTYFFRALHSIPKHKAFTFLNVLGLAIGIASSLLMIQYVKHELSYDDFHEHAENIYRVRFDNGELNIQSVSSFAKIGPAMKDEFPEVENYCRLFLRNGGKVVSYGDVRIKEENLFQVEQSFFDVFSYKLIEGNRATVLTEFNTAVVEKETAKKYFGSENPIGKKIRVGTVEEYVITGIIESPENSHLKFNFLLSFPSSATALGKKFNESWGRYDFYNYLVLKPGTDIAALEAKFPAFIEKHSGEKNGTTKFALQSLGDIHLYSNFVNELRVNGNGKSVYFLSIIAFFILVMAWINYLKLSAIRAVERKKESENNSGRAQLLAESFLINFIACGVGLLLAYIALPLFNEISGKHFTSTIFSDFSLWLALGGLYLTGSLLLGLYPVFFSSSYESGDKGYEAEKTRVPRKSLVMDHFIASIGLVAGTIIIFVQLQFMKTEDLGINIEQTIAINGPGVVPTDTLYSRRLDLFRKELEDNPNIKSFTASTNVPGSAICWTSGSMTTAERGSIMYRIGVDYEFFKTFEAKIIAGRGYAPEFTGDSSSVILNRKAVEMLQLGSPEQAVGKNVIIGDNPFTVVGVLENYHHEGLQQEFRQTAFHLQRNARTYFIAKVESKDVQKTISYMQSKYTAVFPNNPFDYFYIDSFFGRQYNTENQFGSLFGVLALLAISVASLGLLGLVFYPASKNSEKTVVRDETRSGLSGISLLISKDFLRLVLILNLTAVPLVWYLMSQWMSSFAFQIDINFWMFAVAWPPLIINLLLLLLLFSKRTLQYK